MNENRTSKIYLCNGIKLDRGYKNVLNYSESDMVTLCQNEAIASRTTFSFIKHGENKIKVDFTYSDCLRANYIAFQNPDYANKWFFAFIDKVEFVSPSTTILHYTIDEWSTWFNKLVLERCFVIREHVNDDTLGAHKLDEGLALGDYKIQSELADAFNNDVTVVMGTSVNVLASGHYELGVNSYNGIPSPLWYTRYDNEQQLAIILRNLATAGKTDSIVSMFLCPKWLCPNPEGATDLHEIDTSGAPFTKDLGISRITTLDGYTPKNNKTLCYPYCFIGLSNLVGNYITLEQEEWSLDSNNEMIIRMYGTLSSGCSIRCVPLNYKGASGNWNESICVGKFPALAWPNDIYTNWQTQNGVNIFGTTFTRTEGRMLGGSIQTLSGAITGEYSQIGSGIGEIFSAMQEDYRKSLIPPSIEGTLNSGDVVNAGRENRLHAYRVTIEYESAKAIDDYFTMFGYKVNTLKTPNITGRRYWNFIQIGGSEVLGYGNIPHEAMETINKIARAGTTIWHNHTYFGNYALNNEII